MADNGEMPISTRVEDVREIPLDRMRATEVLRRLRSDAPDESRTGFVSINSAFGSAI